MKAAISCALIVAALTAWAAGAHAADARRGYLLASSCAACHGPDGSGAGAIPSLAGKDAQSIASALKQFKSGERAATVMNRLARGYSAEEIDMIAAWWAARPRTASPRADQEAQ